MNGASHWLATISADAYIALPRETFCFQIWGQDIKYIYCLLFVLGSSLQQNMFLNFAVIYKCYSDIFIGEICWLINLDSETVCSFSCKTSSASCNRLLIHLFSILFRSGSFSDSLTMSYPSILHTVILPHICWHFRVHTSSVTFPSVVNKFCY